MNRMKTLLSVLMAASLFTSIAAAGQVPLSLELQADRKNPEAPVMGDHLRFWSTITNSGNTPIEGLVAWISLVEIDPGHEQPVDLEDWSAHKAVTGATLGAGESLHTDWPMRLIQGGDYRVVVSVTNRGGREVFPSRTIQFHVRQKPVLQAGRVLPVAAGVPLLILSLMVFNTARQHRKKDQREKSKN